MAFSPSSTTDPRTPSRGRPRLVAVVAVVLFVWVFLYRFAPLGGAFGGFDNDHFLHFSYAKQVQAGAQPLRDFLDAGLQGARPSLTYELSAAAQRLFGNNLRSEAWLTVAGVATAAAVTFVAASALAPWPWALAMALFSALLSPKLYGYPKVLVLSVAVLLIVRYAQRPGAWRIAVMAAWAAIAFLFRHDYAVYLALGFGVVLAGVHWGAWQQGARRLAALALLTTLFLAPSLWWVQHYTGLVEYVRNGLEMSGREAERTLIHQWPRPVFAGTPSVSAWLDREENTEAWFYYLFLLVPAAAVVSLVRRPRPGDGWQRPAVLAVGVMTLLVWRAFLRGNLEARFGEMAPPVAVLAAWMLAAAFARGPAMPRRIVRGAAALLVLSVSVACVWVLQSVASELRTGRLLKAPSDFAERMASTSAELVSLPGALRGSEDGAMQAAGYLHACTRPTDRVLVVSYAPEVLAFSERLFAGGRATFIPGFYADPRYSRRALAWLRAESVPVALVDPPEQSELYQRFPLLADYLRARYEDVGLVGRWRVLVERNRPPSGSGPAGLPCFN